MDALEAGAIECDATINAADPENFFAAHVLIEALAGSGRTLIHTSGASIVCDDAGGDWHSDRIFNEDSRLIEMSHRAPHVEIDRMVREAGIRKGMRTSVICPALVYGNGSGIGSGSGQIFTLTEKSKKQKAGVYIGKGANVWSNVHISDLVDLYALVLERAPSASFFFAENGEASFREIAVVVSDALGFGSRTFAWNADEAFAELGEFEYIALSTNARVRAKNARILLGWEPKGPPLRDALLSDQ
ncbi:NAD-dependent epimerase/dehydratase family protein [Paraburkholderia sp. GAS334]|uniref:NAD-dependent epimerase/dehydratase family protein n=1 Tax=Paraburkholderia sp. GAS334 TaxID=3035131 RepID=UPI003D2154E8